MRRHNIDDRTVAGIDAVFCIATLTEPSCDKSDPALSNAYTQLAITCGTVSQSYMYSKLQFYSCTCVPDRTPIQSYLLKMHSGQFLQDHICPYMNILS